MEKFEEMRGVYKGRASKLVGIQLVTFVLAWWMNGAIAFGAEDPAVAQGAEITVYKSQYCGCCTKWVDHLNDAGFEVDVRHVSDMGSVKDRIGVPRQYGSCHTAVVGDYWVEGHVPPDLIQRLLSEQPENVEGIAVPGMPLGSPGMEGPNPMEYQVLSVDSEGNSSVYATRMGKKKP